MSTTTNVEGIEPNADPGVVIDNPEDEHYVEHHSDVFYVKIAIVLAAITGMEVWLSYSDIGPIFLPALLILMTIKFVMVVLFSVVDLMVLFPIAWLLRRRSPTRADGFGERLDGGEVQP